MQPRQKTILTTAAIAAAVLAVIIATTLIVRHSQQPERHLRHLPAPTPTATPSSPTPSPTPAVSVDNDTWASWALVHANQVVPGGAGGTSSTESMIKVGLAGVALQGDDDPDARELNLLTRMIRDSDDDAAQQVYTELGGDDAVRRIIAVCSLQHTTITAGWWSKTQMNAADAAQLGACVAAGRFASPHWTGWLLDQMRNVQGEGRFGIIQARPTDHATPLAIKNGWTLREDGQWHVNCLAVTASWSLAVMTRYPAGRGLAHGADVCARVAAAVLPADPAPRRPGPQPD